MSNQIFILFYNVYLQMIIKILVYVGINCLFLKDVQIKKQLLILLAAERIQILVHGIVLDNFLDHEIYVQCNKLSYTNYGEHGGICDSEVHTVKSVRYCLLSPRLFLCFNPDLYRTAVRFLIN